jgi:hypothetical protein
MTFSFYLNKINLKHIYLFNIFLEEYLYSLKNIGKN